MNCQLRFYVLVCALLLLAFCAGCSKSGNSDTSVNGTGPATPRDLLSLGKAEKNDAGEVVELTFFSVNFVADEVAQITELQSLRKLTLQECKSIGDAEMKAVSSLPQLSQLSLIRTKIDDASMKHLGSAKSLNKLLLAHTGAIKSGLEQLAELDLTSLGIHSRTVTADDLAALARITSLKELVLQCPAIKIEELPSLTPLTHLELLDCGLMQLGTDGIERLRGLANLQTLILDATDLNDDSVAGLNSLVELRDLELANGGFTDAGLKLLVLPNVRALSLSGCALLTDSGLHNLGGFTNLRYLDLMDAGVVGKDLTGLASAPTLELVSMSAAQFEGNDRTLSKIKELLPKCKVEILRG
jgi:hypothetical protein